MRKKFTNYLLLTMRSLATWRRKIGLVFVLGHLISDLHAQHNMEFNKVTDKEYYPLSPTAASLGVFGQTAVSYYSGSPAISVPLASVKYKELGIDLSLSYMNASGVKPDDFPGLAGNGWLLANGGVITMISRGISPADLGNSPSVLDLPYATNPPTWKDSSTLASEMLQKKYPYDYNGKRYDQYAYNFGGSSGKFYCDYNDTTQFHRVSLQHIRTIQGEDLTIQKIIDTGFKNFLVPAETQGSPTFTQYNPYPPAGLPFIGPYYRDTLLQNTIVYGFIVTDSRGVQYTFGNTDQSIEFTRPGLNVGDFDKLDQNTTPSSWYLTSIKSPNGALIRLTYKRDKFYIMSTSSIKGAILTTGSPPLTTFAGPEDYQYGLVISSTLYNPTYLDSILTPISATKFYWSVANQQLPYSTQHINGSLTDTISLNSPFTFSAYLDVGNAGNMTRRFSNKLDSFAIYSMDSVKNRVVQFSYSSDTTARLKLLSVKIQGSDNSAGTQQYQFQYDSLGLPPYGSFKTDKYGFYNGRNPYITSSSNSYYVTLLGSPTSFNAYLASREPDSSYTKADILRKIIYPTGGYSYFDYENNRFRKYAINWPSSVVDNGVDSITGGVRIKAITNYDFLNHISEKKRYFYYKNYATGGRSSSGVINFRPVFYAAYNGAISNPQVNGYLSDPRYTGATITYQQFDTDPLYTPSESKGDFINYSEVEEVEADNSYKVFTFKNYDNGYADKPAENILVDNPQIAPFWQEDDVNSLDIERGQMLTESDYDTSGVLRMKTVYDYNDTITRFNSNVRILKAIPNPCFSANFPTLRYLGYLAYTYYPFVKRLTHYDYTTSNDSIVIVTNFVYDSTYRSLTQQTMIESDSGQRTTINRYPPDMVALGQTNPYQAMVTSHRVAPVIEKEDDLNGNILSKQITAYKKGLADDTTLILPYTISSQFRSQSPVMRQRFERYDSAGNILILSQPGSAKTNFVWGYARSNPLAVVVNAPYDSIVAALGGSAAVNSMADQPAPSVLILNGFQPNLRNSTRLKNPQITTYTFNPLMGMTSQTDPRRMTTYYSYDLLGRLSTVRNNDNEVIKQYCYDYAGQPQHCYINSEVKAFSFYFSTNKSFICDVSHHLTQVQLVTLYGIPDIIFDSTSTLQLGGFVSTYYSTPQLTVPLADGYYTSTSTLFLSGVNNFNVTSGKIFYVDICGSGVPPFSLKYTDSIRKHDICDSTYPTKFIYTISNDTPALGKTLYSNYQLTIPTVNGYYLNNGIVYHTTGGLVDSAKSCSALFPPPFVLGYTDTIRTLNICSSPFSSLPVYTLNGDTLKLGRLVYSNTLLTIPAINGYYAYDGFVYHVHSGVVDSALLCTTLFGLPIKNFHGKSSTTRMGICSPLSSTLYFKSTGTAPVIGDTIYGNAGATLHVPAGFVSNGTSVFTVNSSGVVTAIGSCP